MGEEVTGRTTEGLSRGSIWIRTGFLLCMIVSAAAKMETAELEAWQEFYQTMGSCEMDDWGE